MKILEATTSGPDRYGMDGKSRAVLYQLAAVTGLRPGEIRSLRKGSFNFDPKAPTVTVDSAYSKRRQRDELPLPLAFAKELEDYLREKMPIAKAISMPHETNVARMLRLDLEAAGLIERPESEDKKKKPDLPLRDDRDRRIDFHCLRHSFITMLGKTDAHPKTVQALARHSSFALTYDRYTHLRGDEEAHAVEQLPDFTSTTSPLREAATDTNGSQDDADFLPLCLPPGGEKPCNSVSLGDKKTARSVREEQAPNPVGRREKGHLGATRAQRGLVESGSGGGT